MSKIKLIGGISALLLAAMAAWYVQSLRADNERLETEMAQAQEVITTQDANLGAMRQAGQVAQREQIKANDTISSMNKELSAIRRQGVVSNENKNIDPVAVLVAEQLNRLFHAPAHSS